MVKRVVETWNNGGRPTIVSLGVGTILIGIMSIMAWSANLALDSISERLGRIEKSIVRETSLVRQEMTREVCTLDRRVERVEDLVFRGGPGGAK